MNRFLLTPTVVAALAGAVPFSVIDAQRQHGERDAGSSRPINGVDPISGGPVDEAIEPVPVAMLLDGREVVVPIGVGSSEHAARLRAADAYTRALYATAARSNAVVRAGTIVTPPDPAAS